MAVAAQSRSGACLWFAGWAERYAKPASPCRVSDSCSTHKSCPRKPLSAVGPSRPGHVLRQLAGPGTRPPAFPFRHKVVAKSILLVGFKLTDRLVISRHVDRFVEFKVMQHLGKVPATAILIVDVQGGAEFGLGHIVDGAKIRAGERVAALPGLKQPGLVRRRNGVRSPPPRAGRRACGYPRCPLNHWHLAKRSR